MDFRNSKAYLLFIDEIQQHLLRVKEVFFKTTLPTATEVLQAVSSFHTIKGGAGFFGLERIAAISGELELRLAEQDSKLEDKVDEFRYLINELNELAKNLPNPATQQKSPCEPSSKD